MAFASTTQLATRLGRTFTTAETSQARALLDDATAFLQSELGGQLVESGSLTFTALVDPHETRIRLPQWPLRSLTSVTLNGETVTTEVEHKDGHLTRPGGWPSQAGAEFAEVVIAYDYGLDEIPPELVSWCCVLAAGALAQVARGGSLGASGVASERIDDYAVSYRDGSTVFEIPERVLSRLRASYGAGASVTSSR